MKKEPKFKNKYRITSHRLEGYDYSSEGAYFITICCKDRMHGFGEIIDGKLQETVASKICLDCWKGLPNHYKNCVLDEFIIMPNHVHGIIFLKNSNQHNVETGLGLVETGFKPVSTEQIIIKKYPLSEIIRGFKTFTARKINEHQNTQGTSFWQRNYYDRIIRNEEELNRIREYIQMNPERWDEDRNNTENWV